MSYLVFLNPVLISYTWNLCMFVMFGWESIYYVERSPLAVMLFLVELFIAEIVADLTQTALWQVYFDACISNHTTIIAILATMNYYWLYIRLTTLWFVRYEKEP